MAEGEAIHGARLAEHLASDSDVVAGERADSQAASGLEVSLVTIRHLEVGLPERHVRINGEPYEFEIDGHAMSKLANTWDVSGSPMSAERVNVRLDDSIPPSVRPRKRKAARFSAERKAINVSVPGEVVSSDEENEKLAKLLEQSIHGQMVSGMIEMRGRRAAIKLIRFAYKLGALAVPPAGFGIAAATSPNRVSVDHLIGSGVENSLVGYSLLALAGVIQAIVMPHGREYARAGKRFEKWYREVPEQGERPPIKLIPVLQQEVEGPGAE